MMMLVLIRQSSLVAINGDVGLLGVEGLMEPTGMDNVKRCVR